jgi:hypothetical protein
VLLPCPASLDQSSHPRICAGKVFAGGSGARHIRHTQDRPGQADVRPPATDSACKLSHLLLLNHQHGVWSCMQSLLGLGQRSHPHLHLYPICTPCALADVWYASGKRIVLRAQSTHITKATAIGVSFCRWERARPRQNYLSLRGPDGHLQSQQGRRGGRVGSYESITYQEPTSGIHGAR